MTSLDCGLCTFRAGSVRELRLHLIRHGAPAVAAAIGLPDLAVRGSWGFVLKKAVDAMARGGVSHA